MAPGTLDGIRVIDLSRILAGPYCTMMLGDYGAEIIKIEQPGTGDFTRHWGPPWMGDQSAYFLSANRNKKSLTLNLKSEEGQAILKRLVKTADIVIENFKPGTTKRMGLDYDSLTADHPGLIYCSISGYGQDGPYRNRPGYDFIIQAQGGIMSINGPVDGEPYKVGVAVIDVTTGLYACNAILAALHERQHSGQGQYIDVALLDSQLGWLVNVAQNYFATGETPGRYGNAHPNIVPYEIFPTADGYVAVGIGSDAQYQRFCETAVRPDLWHDERFQVAASRVKHRDILIPLLQELFRSCSTNEWIDALLAINIPVGPINDIKTILNDPHITAREMVQTVEHPTAGEMQLIGPVAKLSRTPAQIQSAPPTLGAHTAEILRQLLGYSVSEIEDLHEKGIV